MSALAIFKFEASQIRTFGNAETPLFVAIDVASALGYKQITKAVLDHVDPEDIVKTEIATAGGKQVVNCVNESGLYALIFGSKLESAKRFKRWVTTEVLPAIRKTGGYTLPQTLTPDEQYKIQKAVAERARKSSESFRTIYRAIKTRYQIPKYSLLPRAKFEECLKFIETLNLAVPEKVETPRKPEKKTFIVTEDLLKRLQTFVYCWRYLFRKDLERFTDFLYSVNSPYAPHFWEAVHDLHLALLEKNLEKLGFGPKDLDCYKFWAKTNSNLLGCADRFE